MEQFIQEWRGKESQSLKAFTYFSFKHNIELEKYFVTVPEKMFWLLVKIRTANHKLPIETGRWDGTARHERIGHLCHLRDIGDEFHNICKCPFFNSERLRFLKPYYIHQPSMFKLGKLLASTNESEMRKHGPFAQIIFRKFT